LHTERENNHWVQFLEKLRSIDFLATAPKDEQFWYEWEVRMMFDSELTTLHSAILRITDLGFDDNIDPKKREDIKKKFFCGNLIVS
jgi:hypothetical protein